MSNSYGLTLPFQASTVKSSTFATSTGMTVRNVCSPGLQLTVDRFITTPLLLMDLLLTAAMPWPTTLFVILVDEFMIVTGLVGALVKSSYKWGYFVFGCCALGYIVYNLVWDARKHASALGKDVGSAFLVTITTHLFNVNIH